MILLTFGNKIENLCFQIFSCKMTSIFNWSRCVMNSEDCQWFDKQKYSEHTIHFHWIHMGLGKRLKGWLLVWDFVYHFAFFSVTCEYNCICIVYVFPSHKLIILETHSVTQTVSKLCDFHTERPWYTEHKHSDKSSWSIKKSPLVLALGDVVRIHDTVWPRPRSADRGIQMREYVA